MAVQMRSMLAVADNSGARKLQMILPLGGGLGKKASLGDIITAAVITSPRLAFFPNPPPRGRIICSLRAPELSATASMDLICTAMVFFSLVR